jgi:hypothetical protein
MRKSTLIIVILAVLLVLFFGFTLLSVQKLNQVEHRVDFSYTSSQPQAQLLDNLDLIKSKFNQEVVNLDHDLIEMDGKYLVSLSFYLSSADYQSFTKEALTEVSNLAGLPQDEISVSVTSGEILREFPQSYFQVW